MRSLITNIIMILTFSLIITRMEDTPLAHAWYLNYPDNYFTFGHDDPSACESLVDKIEVDGLGNVLVAGRT